MKPERVYSAPAHEPVTTAPCPREVSVESFDPCPPGPQPHNLEEETCVDMGRNLIDIIES